MKIAACFLSLSFLLASPTLLTESKQMRKVEVQVVRGSVTFGINRDVIGVGLRSILIDPQKYGYWIKVIGGMR